MVNRKRNVYNKYKDPHHPAVKSACKAARTEIRISRRNFEKKLADNINRSLLMLAAKLKLRSKSVHLLEAMAR